MSSRFVKIRTFFFGLLAAISIFVSPIAACACSHHFEEKVESKTESCHEHLPEATAEKNSDASAIGESGCVCFQSAPKTFAKTETIKFDAHTAKISQIDLPELKSLAPEIRAKFCFAKPFYLSDSFYNLSPGRAPPVL